MTQLELLFAISSAFFVLMLWVIMVLVFLRSLTKDVDANWQKINQVLKKRQDLVPLVVEIVRKYTEKQEVLIQKLIDDRMKSAKELDANARKIEYENDLSKSLYRVVDLGKLSEALDHDLIFLSAKRDIAVSEKAIKLFQEDYNRKVRKFNGWRNFFLFRPIAFIFAIKESSIFEFEPLNAS